MEARKFTINFLGDVMLGRLIDQCFPVHVHEPSEAAIVRSFAERHQHLKHYGPESPWGSTLPLLQSSDLNVINLETSVTTSTAKWPNKVFNYRMHPENIKALEPAKISYVTLANNHTLDFSEAGLEETVKTIKDAGIAFAGAGNTRQEALSPAQLRLPNALPGPTPRTVHIWAGSDHPSDWSTVSNFHLIDYTPATRARLKEMLTTQPNASRPALKIISIHWGPNYAWHPSNEIKSLARFLIDECDVDIVHGHSSHHIQGVELYKRRLVIYGCGDFVDDYALVEEFRNDLSGVWRVTVGPVGDGARLGVEKLELFPTRIERFRAQRLQVGEADHEWVRRKFGELSRAFGTEVREMLGQEGQVVVDVGDGSPGL